MKMNNNIIYLDCTDNLYVGDSITNKTNNYQLKNCVLIRTTNIFPFNKLIETPKNARGYSFAKSSIIGDAIIKKVKKDIAFDPFNDEEYEKLDKELKKYEVAFETFRSTIHFTINGLVSSHLYGNFDNRDFIIIEPLQYHINNKSLRALRAEDTYFNDDLYLSNEACIIIKEEKFNEIKEKEEYIDTLSKFKIFIYKGTNQSVAVKEALNYLGYDFFLINNHGYVNGLENNTAANKMWNFLDELRTNYQLSSTPHFYSKDNEQDIAKREEEGIKTDTKHFLYIVNNATTINEELKNKIIMLFNKNKEEFKTIIPEIIEAITLKEIERLTKNFNEIFIENLKNKSNNHKNKN